MFDSSSVIVGLEIGTSKICAIVGELSPDGALNVVDRGGQTYAHEVRGFGVALGQHVVRRISRRVSQCCARMRAATVYA